MITMRQYTWTLALFLVIVCHFAESRSIVKRQANGIHVNAVSSHEIPAHGYRDKAKVEAFYGVKNALLGFVFHKINSFIDQKTAWVAHLDQTNIAKNAAQGIVPPKDPVLSLSGIISGVIGDKLQQAGPFITLVTNKLTSGSTGGSAHASGGFNFGSLLGGSSGGHAGAGATGYGAAI